MAVTRTKDQKRRGEIIRALSDLAKGGWAGAKPYDYQPLEQELQQINDKEQGNEPR